MQQYVLFVSIQTKYTFFEKKKKFQIFENVTDILKKEWKTLSDSPTAAATTTKLTANDIIDVVFKVDFRS